MRVTVFVSGFAIFFANATKLLLVLNINSSAAHFVSSSTRSISLRIVFKASGTKTGTSQQKLGGFFPRTDATVLNHRYPLRSYEAL